MLIRVSVIVVNYNGKGLITDCLRAIEGQSFKNFEVIVVDNGSSDDSVVRIREFAGRSHLSHAIRIIPLCRNLGFGGGNIVGLNHSQAEYVALLNNDTEAEQKWLEELITAMDSDPKIGICASKLIVYGTDIIDSAGDGFSFLLKGFKRGEGEKASLYDKKEYIFGACAGAALYRRKMIDEVGFLDEDFFLIHEDTDLNLRAQLHGWKVLYVPTAIVYHKVRSSIGKMSHMAIYYTLRNSEFVRIKNVPLSIFIRCFSEFIIRMVTEFVYFAIKHRNMNTYLRAKRDAIRMLPKMLKKRAITMENRKANDKYVLNIMTPIWQKDFLREKIKKFLKG
jgi:hypothetical protein